jgi:glucokinase
VDRFCVEKSNLYGFSKKSCQKNNKVIKINKLPPSHILTADIGGSHITVGICELETHTILQQTITRVEVESQGSATEILTSWSDVFQHVVKNAAVPVLGLSVAMPGPFDYENGISYIRGLHKFEALFGMDLKVFLGDVLKLDPQFIKFRNDAESAIEGEVLAGAGKGHQRVMGVTLGTGFGSAYSENKVTRDINLGSEPYKQTIADDYLSTRWFSKRYHELNGTILTGGVKELADIAPESEVARAIFQEFATNMIDFLSGPINHFKPEVLVICGKIANSSAFFLPFLTKGLNSTNIRLAQLGENAPLIGAAAMFKNLTAPSPNSVNQL